MLGSMPDQDDILRRAMELPVEARAALAGTLLQSLDRVVDPDAEAAWSAEITRRLAQLDDGSVRPLTMDEARKRISG